MSTVPRQSFEHHDQHQVTVFDVIGSFFVEIYYNHLYNLAVRKVRDIHSDTSITRLYRSHVMIYTEALVKEGKAYNDTVAKLHIYFREHTRFRFYTLVEFIEHVVKYFVPEDYVPALRSRDQDEILSQVICDLVKRLSVRVTLPEVIVQVIDQRKQRGRETVAVLQDFCIDCLINKQNHVISKFLQEHNGVRYDDQSLMIEKLRQTLRAQVKENAEVKAALAREKKQRRQLASEAELLGQQVSALKAMVKRQHSMLTTNYASQPVPVPVVPRDHTAPQQPVVYPDPDQAGETGQKSPGPITYPEPEWTGQSGGRRDEDTTGPEWTGQSDGRPNVSREFLTLIQPSGDDKSDSGSDDDSDDDESDPGGDDTGSSDAEDGSDEEDSDDQYKGY